MLFTVESLPKNLSEADPAKVLKLMDQDKAQYIESASRYKPYSSEEKPRIAGTFVEHPDVGAVIYSSEENIETPNGHFLKINFPPWLTLYKPSDISDEDFSAYKEERLKDVSTEGLLRFRESALDNEKKRKEFADDVITKYEGNLPIVLNQERASAVGIAFFVWAIPMVIFYFFGWCVGWIYRGFKKQA